MHLVLPNVKHGSETARYPADLEVIIGLLILLVVAGSGNVSPRRLRTAQRVYPVRVRTPDSQPLWP